MNDTVTLATILLILRFIAVGLLVATIVKQVKQIRNTITDYPILRITILVLTTVLLLGQFIPIILDWFVAFELSDVGRKNPPDPLSISYALNNAIKDVVIGTLLTFIYYGRRPTR